MRFNVLFTTAILAMACWMVYLVAGILQAAFLASMEVL